MGSETLRLDANIFISTRRAKAASLALLEVIANLLPGGWIYDWTGWFLRRWATRCDSEVIWSMKCLMRYELAISWDMNWLSFTVRGKLHWAVQIIILHHFWQDFKRILESPNVPSTVSLSSWRIMGRELIKSGISNGRLPREVVGSNS